MTRTILWMVFAASLIACGPALQEGAKAPSDDPAAAPPAASALSKKLLGRWTMAPPPSERRLVALTRWALAEPPDEAAFAKTSPTPDEQQKFSDVVRLRRQEPGSPLLRALHRKLDELDGVQVVFDEKQLVTTTPTGTSVKGYTVEKELDGELVLLEDGDEPAERRRSIVSFAGDDEMVLTHGATRVPLVRATGPRKATEAPSGATEASTRGKPADRPTGTSALDDCERRYFACTDAMPPEARAAMGPSLEGVKKLFALTRSGATDVGSTLSACKTAVDAMEMAGLCGVK